MALFGVSEHLTFTLPSVNVVGTMPQHSSVISFQHIFNKSGTVSGS